MRKLLDFVIIILIVAAISSAATRIYMIRTATPSTVQLYGVANCTITDSIWKYYSWTHSTFPNTKS